MPYDVQRQQQALRDKRARLSQALQAQAAANGVSNVMLNFSGLGDSLRTADDQTIASIDPATFAPYVNKELQQRLGPEIMARRPGAPSSGTPVRGAAFAPSAAPLGSGDGNDDVLNSLLKGWANY
jgi:hypothetical protein